MITVVTLFLSSPSKRPFVLLAWITLFSQHPFSKKMSHQNKHHMQRLRRAVNVTDPSSPVESSAGSSETSAWNHLRLVSMIFFFPKALLPLQQLNHRPLNPLLRLPRLRPRLLRRLRRPRRPSAHRLHRPLLILTFIPPLPRQAMALVPLPRPLPALRHLSRQRLHRVLRQVLRQVLNQLVLSRLIPNHLSRWPQLRRLPTPSQQR